MDIIDRFLKYVSFDTTSKEVKKDEASSQNQYKLAEEIKKEMIDLGGEDIHINKYGTVYGYFPGQIEGDSVVLIAHMDTSNAAKGKDIKPRIIKKYDGKDIKLSDETTMKVEDFPSLLKSVGHELIVTDGTTLLGADDKAGIAIAMDVVNYFVKNKIPHRSIELVFSTDEEIGVGADHIEIERLHSKYGYTIDGGDIHYLCIENFNAASMKVEITGRSIHPGSAKDKMINAVNVGVEFHDSLPKFMRPEHTENREGFYHIIDFNGNEEKTTMNYIVREFDSHKLDSMLDYAKLAEERLNHKYGTNVVKVDIVKTYKNMRPIIEKQPEIIGRIEKIYKEKGIDYEFEPIRGGTDGAVLTNRGFSCPNLGTGGANFHGRFEYLDVDQMKQMVEILIELYK
ncbi:MAG: peptidase T [Bacilli bacterium]